MTTVLEPHSSPDFMDNIRLASFLRELTSLCLSHGVGITAGSKLFILEYEDCWRTFSADENSQLMFA